MVTSRAKEFARTYFALYGLGALLIAVNDVFFARTLSNATSWGYAPGWLREIACFDVFVAALCGRAAFGHLDAPALEPLAWTLAVLSLLIGSNNLHAYCSSGKAAHLQGALIHAAALVAGIFCARQLTTKGRSSPS